jgi:hypothetical protein
MKKYSHFVFNRYIAARREAIRAEESIMGKIILVNPRKGLANFSEGSCPNFKYVSKENLLMPMAVLKRKVLGSIIIIIIIIILNIIVITL